MIQTLKEDFSSLKLEKAQLEVQRTSNVMGETSHSELVNSKWEKTLLQSNRELNSLKEQLVELQCDNNFKNKTIQRLQHEQNLKA